jgi:potassium efflux system protein
VILLEHLSVDAGIRFAATCLVRYAIFTAGVCGAFAQIGIGWSNVQWLVAAGSVGLGFGLQEIFCNFVSGIILLFERPMRVGDVVTIGDTTGTVSRIRFRATTIVDGDRKELIVPNKEFITGHLLNWTLSDRVNRVGVRVVASSHSDPQRVRKLLLEIAAQQPSLLKDPPPSATLEDVNGGLTFMLRGFLPTLDSRGTAIHDLYTSVYERFKSEGIELSCPTQEITVRMDSGNTLSAAPAGPHQIPTGVPIKPAPPDFTAALRRA